MNLIGLCPYSQNSNYNLHGTIIEKIIKWFPQVRWMPPPPMGCPRGGSVTKNSKKTPCPPSLRETLRRGSFVERTIFMNRMWTKSIHVCFSRAVIWDCTVAGPFCFFYIKTQTHHKDVKGQRKYYHYQRTNLNLIQMIRFFFFSSVMSGYSCRMKKERVCLATSLYSQLNFFVFLL